MLKKRALDFLPHSHHVRQVNVAKMITQWSHSCWCKTPNLKNAASGWAGSLRRLACPMVSKRGLCRQNTKRAQALDRSLIASAATASKEVTSGVRRLVVRHYVDSKACCQYVCIYASCIGMAVTVLLLRSLDYHQTQEAGSETDGNGVQRLPLRREGWNFWDFEGNKVHYIQAGPSMGLPIVHSLLSQSLLFGNLNHQRN